MTTLIDCTLRDGGHLNNWNFDISFVKDLYCSASLAGVEYFEFGYRNNKYSNSLGKFATCDDEFLYSILDGLSGCKISVMADVGKSDIKLFSDKKSNNTVVDLVRVAVYPDKLEQAFGMCEELKNKGYQVMLNLMAFGKYCSSDYEKLNKWQNKDILKSVCFADSFGSFFPKDIEKYYNILSDLGFNNISFHSHNNLQLAFANSMKFVELGGYSLDASANGIGRGGGILPMELILGYFQLINSNSYSMVPYLEFLNKYFSNQANLESILSGFMNLHPNYIKKLFKNSRNIAEICQSLDKNN